ncbi:MAG: tetratricopeptide repeat protein [Sphingorhabdus sp.]
MRFSPPVIALSAVFLMASSASIGKKADHEIDPLSASLVAEGVALQKGGDLENARGLYETALAVDPRNRAAFVGMAEVSAQQGLKGSAIGFYKSALDIEPNDIGVIAAQGELMASKGALDAAKKNLARLQILCRSKCGESDRLAVAIDKAVNKEALQASAVEIKPTVEKAN